MLGFFEPLHHIQLSWRDGLDIAIVSLLVWQVVRMLRGSRAVAALAGLGLLALLYYFANAHGLYTLYWLLQYIFSSLFIMIVVIFQADIRRALGAMVTPFTLDDVTWKNIEIIIGACVEMAQKRIGAIIVIERGNGLGDMMKQEGVYLDAIISRELLLNLFYPKAPLHDGAVVISKGKIMAAGCILPLAVAQGENFGTRHRAAMGITKDTDAVAIVVSEERGEISIAYDGALTDRDLDANGAFNALNKIFNFKRTTPPFLNKLQDGIKQYFKRIF